MNQDLLKFNDFGYSPVDYGFKEIVDELNKMDEL
jgi:hypothetical protein